MERRIVYVSRLTRLPLLGADGADVGRIVDGVVDLGSKPPRVHGVVVAVQRRRVFVGIGRKWTEEAKNGNADGVARLRADGFVETDADSSVHSRAQTLALIKTGKWEANQISDLKVAVYGKAAVVTGTWLGKGTSNGKPVDAREAMDGHLGKDAEWEMAVRR